MPMRGEDVIGVAHDDDHPLRLLKGEAKSAQVLSRQTVETPRGKLEEDYGRPSAHFLMFVARKLIQSEPRKEGVGKGDSTRSKGWGGAAAKARPSPVRTLTGNQVDQVIRDDLNGADGSRPQLSVNLRIPDHGDFVEAVYEGAYEEAGSVGDG